ncbi:hypothetical protein [Luteolibacter sp. LG18]|uniref:hypothetical protein n=1 Tax=Luteolibacter sp. LG18 TaxID=2819286 RepID=UPI002B31A2C9|nr:hypothetical protein llg_15780 [Luteolibacter sp. LG18]
MLQPIPANSDVPLKVGDRIRIVPEFQEPGDDQFESVVIETAEDCTRVLIRTFIPGFVIQQVERIEARMLEVLG